MSSPQIRRADRAMSEERARRVLAQGYSGRLATIGEDGFPYCIPLLYLWIDERRFSGGAIKDEGDVILNCLSANGFLRNAAGRSVDNNQR